MICATKIYTGSDGKKTQAMYDLLKRKGYDGLLAIDLFRATKASARAKLYRGNQFKEAAYQKKTWSLANLCRRLKGGPYTWGWLPDKKMWVLYVDMPSFGQMSWHSRERGEGPDYTGEWDKQRRAVHLRVIAFTQHVINS